MNRQDLGESHVCLTLTSILTICQGLISLGILEMLVCRVVGRWNALQRYLPNCSGKLELRAERGKEGGSVRGDRDEEISADLRWLMYCG